MKLSGMKLSDLADERKSKLEKADPPQVLAPLPDYRCSQCGALDSFVVYRTHGHGNVQYLKCKKCGKTATRRIAKKA